MSREERGTDLVALYLNLNLHYWSNLMGMSERKVGFG